MILVTTAYYCITVVRRGKPALGVCRDHTTTLAFTLVQGRRGRRLGRHVAFWRVKRQSSARLRPNCPLTRTRRPRPLDVASAFGWVHRPDADANQSMQLANHDSPRIHHVARYRSVVGCESQLVPCLTSKLANNKSSAGSPPKQQRDAS